MAAVRKSPAADVAGDVPVPDFEVQGDDLVCHKYADLRLSLLVPMAVLDRWTEINNSAGSWREQVNLWQQEIIPVGVLAAIRDAAAGDGIKEIEMCRQWSAGLDVRLGKALY